MSFIEVKINQTKKGASWLVVNRTWNSTIKKYQVRKLTPIVFKDLGFSETMTLVQARNHAKKINALNKVKRKETQKKVQASERLQDLVIKSTALFPTLLVEQFVIQLEEDWFGGAYNLKKLIFNFGTAQKIITQLNVLPNEYYKRRKAFYKYFISQKYSMSYVEKLIKVINQWGEYYASETQTYFKKLSYPQGVILEQIKNSAKVDGEGATPLTVDILKRLKGKLPEGQYEYIYVSFYFGLRPSEIDNIISDKNSFEIKEEFGIKILSVNQSKLTGIAAAKRWKRIPVILKEQFIALKFIEEEVIKKPLVKTIKKAVPDLNKIGLYSGRKGFTDLMLNYSQNLEDISQWLGHKSIDRTWKSYKNKNVVHYNPVKLAK